MQERMHRFSKVGQRIELLKNYINCTGRSDIKGILLVVAKDLNVVLGLDKKMRENTSNTIAQEIDLLTGTEIVYRGITYRKTAGLSGEVITPTCSNAVQLTAQENSIFYTLLYYAEEIVPHQVLISAMSGSIEEGVNRWSINTLRSYIYRLRNKIGDGKDQYRYIHSVWRVGYKLEVVKISQRKNVNMELPGSNMPSDPIAFS